jgi:hypothetical protein
MSKTELEKWKHNWNQEAVKIEKVLEILDEFPKTFPLNKNKKGDIEIWHFEDLKKIITRAHECLVTENTKEET